MNKLIIIGLLIGWSNNVFKLKDKPLLEAARSGNLKELIESLKHEDVNIVVDINGRTALMKAAEGGHRVIVRR